MALFGFTKLRERVIGSNVKFDDLELIESKGEDSEDDDADDAVAAAGHQGGEEKLKRKSFLFRRSKKEKTIKVAPSVRKEEIFNIDKENKNFVNIMPGGNVNSDTSSSKRNGVLQSATNQIKSECVQGKSEAEAPPPPPAVAVAGPPPAPAVDQSQPAAKHQFTSNRASAQPSVLAGNPIIQESTSHSVNAPPSTESATDKRFSTSRLGAGASSKSASSSSKSNDSARFDREDDAEENDADHMDTELSGMDLTDFVFSKARHNHSVAVFDALSNGFEINARDINGNTILHICSQNNRRKLASALMQQYPSCELNAKNLKACTPLDYSDKYGFHNLSNWLSMQGALHGIESSQFTSKMR
jgi:hypothetical protein